MKNNNKLKNLLLTIAVIVILTILAIFGKQLDIDNIIVDNSLDIGILPSNFEISDESNLQIIYFYVGDADCILIKDNKDVMLIDTGNDADGKYLVEYLKRLGITEINYLIGTHEHEDHIGGMDYIIREFDIDNIYLPKIKDESSNQYRQVISEKDKKGYVIQTPIIGDTWNIGDSECIVKYVGEKESNPNNNSIVIELENNNIKYLFTGDIEEKVERTITWDSIDVLKVAHHGADTSTSEKFLKEVFPERDKLKSKITIISTGNRDNLLDEIILNRLKGIENNKIYITRDVGSIYITNDNGINIVEILKTKVDSRQH